MWAIYERSFPQVADDGAQHLVRALSGWWVALSMEHGRTWLITFIWLITLYKENDSRLII